MQRADTRAEPATAAVGFGAPRPIGRVGLDDSGWRVFCSALVECIGPCSGIRLDRRDQVHWRNDLLAATCTLPLLFAFSRPPMARFPTLGAPEAGSPRTRASGALESEPQPLHQLVLRIALRSLVGARTTPGSARFPTVTTNGDLMTELAASAIALMLTIELAVAIACVA